MQKRSGRTSNYPHRRRAFGICFLVGAIAATGACSFQDFDYLKKRRASAAGGAGGEGDGGTSSDVAGSTSTLGGSTSNAGSDNSAGARTGGAGGAANAAGAAGAGVAGSGVVAPLLGPFNFDTESTVFSWQVGGDSSPGSTVSWAAQGEAEPLGSLVCSATGLANITFTVPGSAANQSNRTLFFRVRTESGTAAIKPFAFSAGYIWSDGGETQLTTTWTMATMNLQAPAYESLNYNPSQIVAVGFQVPNGGVIWIDRIWVEAN